jgi:phosphinothricin acetyltransferase
MLSDARAVAEIYNQAIRERVATFETDLRTERAMRDWLRERDERHPVLVAMAEPNPAGTRPREPILGWASIASYRPRACYDGVGEFSVYVRKGHRGAGTGKTLLLSLVDEARRLGYWKLVSRIFPFNAPSRELCRACGFREVGIYEKHGKLDGQWLDTLIVERLIPENLDRPRQGLTKQNHRSKRLRP